MIKKISSLLLMILIFTGCTEGNPVVNNQPITTIPESQDESKITDFFTTIKSAVDEGATFTYLHDFEPQNFPTDIYPEQFNTKTATQLKNLIFLMIEQPNMNYDFSPLYVKNNNYKITWAGVLVSHDNGQSWYKFYTIQDPPFPENPPYKDIHNPIGLFTKNGKLFLDLVDSRGAGSGEGFITRLISEDGGKTWKKEGCYYLMPENYFVPMDGFVKEGKNVLETIHPETAKESKECLYEIADTSKAITN